MSRLKRQRSFDVLFILGTGMSYGNIEEGQLIHLASMELGGQGTEYVLEK